jgi:hypothetical protein
LLRFECFCSHLYKPLGVKIDVNLD